MDNNVKKLRVKNRVIFKFPIEECEKSIETYNSLINNDNIVDLTYKTVYKDCIIMGYRVKFVYWDEVGQQD